MSIIMSSNEVKGLLRYKYNGGDTSYTYYYILSPLAQFLVDSFIPKWMAPNLITFIGFLFSLSSFLLTLFCNYDLDRNGPKWLPLIVAINLFIYQTLDNMDGKQARKTGTSSPLGMIFDHGIDAINAVLLILPVAAALGTGKTNEILILMSIGFIPFLTQGWEEYYREEMVLPVINGPSEGLLITMGLLLYSSYYGAEVFHVVHQVPAELLSTFSFLPETYTGYDIAKLNFYLALTLTASSQIIVGSWKAYEKGGFFGLLRAYLNLVPFIVFYFSSLLWCFQSPVAFKQYHVLTLLLLGSIFVELATHTMLMHICDSTIKPSKRYTMWIPLILAANLAFSSVDGVGIISEEYLILPFTVFSVYYTAERFCSIIVQSADELNIYILVQGKPRLTD